MRFRIRKRYQTTFEGKNGFTLLEVVISFGIVMFIIAAFVGIQVLVRQSYLFSINASVSIDHANSVTQDLVRVIRQARTADNGAYPIEVLGDQEIVVYANVDKDTEIERVRYFLEGTELKRGVIDPTAFPVEYLAENEKVKVMTEYVRNGSEPLYYYYNENWPSDTTNNPLVGEMRLSDASFVQVVVNINSDADRPEGNYQLATFVNLRNLKENL